MALVVREAGFVVIEIPGAKGALVEVVVVAVVEAAAVVAVVVLVA